MEMVGTLAYRNASPALQPRSCTLAVKAVADEQALPRVTGVLALYGIVPTLIVSRRDGDYLQIEIQFDSDDLQRRDLLLGRLQAMVLVKRASVLGES